MPDMEILDVLSAFHELDLADLLDGRSLLDRLPDVFGRPRDVIGRLFDARSPAAILAVGGDLGTDLVRPALGRRRPVRRRQPRHRPLVRDDAPEPRGQAHARRGAGGVPPVLLRGGVPDRGRHADHIAGPARQPGSSAPGRPADRADAAHGRPLRARSRAPPGRGSRRRAVRRARRARRDRAREGRRPAGQAHAMAPGRVRRRRVAGDERGGAGDARRVRRSRRIL